MDLSPQDKKALNKALEEIRAFLRRDGGDLRIVKIEEETVFIQFLGNCMHCHIKNVTLELGIKAIFQKYLPYIKKVEEIKTI